MLRVDASMLAGTADLRIDPHFYMLSRRVSFITAGMRSPLKLALPQVSCVENGFILASG